MKDGKHVILCVDDDPDILEALKTVLEAHGYVVATAGSAQHGLKAYKESCPDAVIVDLMMEEVDAGTSMVKELKMVGNTAPIFMLSSVGDDLNMETDYNTLGLSGVFQKPVDNERLIKFLAAKLG